MINKSTKILKFAVMLVVMAVIIILGVNAIVAFSTEGQILEGHSPEKTYITKDEVDRAKSINPQCILVFGAGVRPDKTPSPMLRDRLDTAIELYKKGVAPKLLMSGDNGSIYYNEVQCMLDYAVDKGVPKEDIFLDHAGFSTYDSIDRAKKIFGVNSAILVTQKYHLFRAIWGCNRAGIEALGVPSNQQVYSGRFYREAREVLARDKDVLKWITKPDALILGDTIDISKNGTVSH